MANLLNVGDVLLARWECRSLDQVSINDMHYEVQSVVGIYTDAALAAQLSAQQTANYTALLNTGDQYLGCRLSRVFPVKTPSILDTSGGGAGVVASGKLPNQCCSVITKLSNIPGPGGRGRFYFPFPTIGDTDGLGNPSAGYNTALGVVIGGMLGPTVFTTGPDHITIKAVLFNRVTHVVTPLSGASVPGKFGTQKSRGAYGKPNNP